MEEIIKIRVDINDIKENNTKKECCFFKKGIHLPNEGKLRKDKGKNTLKVIKRGYQYKLK